MLWAFADWRLVARAAKLRVAHTDLREVGGRIGGGRSRGRQSPSLFRDVSRAAWHDAAYATVLSHAAASPRRRSQRGGGPHGPLPRPLDGGGGTPRPDGVAACECRMLASLRPGDVEMRLKANLDG